MKSNYEDYDTNKTAPDDKAVGENNMVAALSYIWIFCFVPLFLNKKSKFAQFHAKQGLVLFIIELVGWMIPVVGWVLFLLAIVYAILGVRAALAGEYWEMPILGKYAKKINL